MWREVNSGLGGVDIHGLALDPREPQKLHAMVREKGEGLYRTTDGGAKWVRVDDGPGGEVKVLSSVNISTGMGGIFLYAGTGQGLTRNGFAVDPSNPRTMYASMRADVFRSDNAGANWTRVTTGPKNVAAVTVNPKKPSEVYAATMEGGFERSALA